MYGSIFCQLRVISLVKCLRILYARNVGALWHITFDIILLLIAVQDIYADADLIQDKNII